MKILLPVIASCATYAPLIYGISRTGLLNEMAPLPRFSFSFNFWLDMARAPTGNIAEVLVPLWVILFFWLYIFNRTRRKRE